MPNAHTSWDCIDAQRGNNAWPGYSLLSADVPYCNPCSRRGFESCIKTIKSHCWHLEDLVIIFFLWSTWVGECTTVIWLLCQPSVVPSWVMSLVCSFHSRKNVSIKQKLSLVVFDVCMAGDVDRATGLIQRCLEVDQTSSDAHILMAQVLTETEIVDLSDTARWSSLVWSFVTFL